MQLCAVGFESSAGPPALPSVYRQRCIYSSLLFSLIPVRPFLLRFLPSFLSFHFRPLFPKEIWESPPFFLVDSVLKGLSVFRLINRLGLDASALSRLVPVPFRRLYCLVQLLWLTLRRTRRPTWILCLNSLQVEWYEDGFTLNSLLTKSIGKSTCVCVSVCLDLSSESLIQIGPADWGKTRGQRL